MGIRAFATVVVALLISIASATPASAAPRDDVINQTNGQRAAAGLPALIADPKLDAAAQEWAQQMARSNQMVHSSNEWRASRIPAGWFTHGENIAWGQPNATAVMRAWMDSLGHKQNILRSSYSHIGVGYVASGNYWVQIFAGYDASKAPIPSPFGALDSAEVTLQSGQGKLSVSGWAIDRAQPTASIPVHIYVTDPAGKTVGYPVAANEGRPDVGASFPIAGASHGYRVSLPLSATGTYRVCVYAIGKGSNPSIGCRDVAWKPATPTGANDFVGITMEGVTPILKVRGWALDLSSRQAFTQAHVYVVDPRGKSTGYAINADGSRPDVGAAFPGAGSNHGFEFQIAAPVPGNYNVCAYSIGASPYLSVNSPLGCKSVRLASSAPTGSMDSVTVDRATRSLAVRGWVMDDALRSVTTEAHVYVTAPGGVTTGYAVRADQQRGDVAQAFPGAGASHGFTASMPASAPGTYRVCAYSITAPQLVAANRSLGCRDIAS